MSQQACPAVEDLSGIIAYHRENLPLVEGEDEEKIAATIDSLEWLKTFLLNRRNYQRKQQVKRKVMMRLITEHDLGRDLDENIAATYGVDLERFDDNANDD